MNKHYIQRQDGSIYIITASQPESFLEDAENDIVLEISPENEPNKDNREFWTVDGGQIVVDETAKTEAERSQKMANIRAHRDPLLEEADHQINIILDAAGDESAWRTYRQELRDITETFKTDPSNLDAVTDVAEDITWPTKP